MFAFLFYAKVKEKLKNMRRFELKRVFNYLIEDYLMQIRTNIFSAFSLTIQLFCLYLHKINFSIAIRTNFVAFDLQMRCPIINL